MKKILVAAAMAVATGCVMQSTYSQIMAKPADLAFSTQNSVDEFMGCVSPAIAAMWPNVSTIQDGPSKVLSVVGAQVLVTVKATPNPTGSSVEVRQIYPGRGYQRASEAADACR